MQSQKTYRKFRRKYYLQEAVKNQRQRMWLNKKTERQIQIIVSLFFTGLILTGIFGTLTLLTWNFIFRIYLGIALVLSFVPLKYYPLIYKIQRELKLLFVVCGISPFLMGIILMLNYSFTTYSHTETYKISNYHVYTNDHLIEVTLENNKYKKHKEIRKFSTDEFHFEPDSAVFEIHEGIFTLSVVKNSYLIKR